MRYQLRMATEAQAQTQKQAEEAATAQKAGETAHAETAAQVLEALERPRLTALPNAPGALVGMVNHRELMLPVLDLGLLLGGPACGADAPVLVCQSRRGQGLALRVQALGQVFSIAAAQAQASPARVGWAGQTRLVRGAGAGMLTLLEADALWAQISGVAPQLEGEATALLLA